ncbi:hypothetical protein BJ508DRAFT_311017 [Ascobolus immersus RN42]|uniref:Uncharacterized protein n=1 Tax=Ascobolus immersus RN42 TaxID=1160509 RepID=A0A3N4HXD8_ASCIM|nr:hypothetical protein BJ508DRAFT_311017 [Ascobolus immersus RN42]
MTEHQSSPSFTTAPLAPPGYTRHPSACHSEDQNDAPFYSTPPRSANNSPVQPTGFSKLPVELRYHIGNFLFTYEDWKAYRHLDALNLHIYGSEENQWQLDQFLDDITDISYDTGTKEQAVIIERLRLAKWFTEAVLHRAHTSNWARTDYFIKMSHPVIWFIRSTHISICISDCEAETEAEDILTHKMRVANVYGWLPRLCERGTTFKKPYDFANPANDISKAHKRLCPYYAAMKEKYPHERLPERCTEMLREPGNITKNALKAYEGSRIMVTLDEDYCEELWWAFDQSDLRRSTQWLLVGWIREILQAVETTGPAEANIYTPYMALELIFVCQIYETMREMFMTFNRLAALPEGSVPRLNEPLAKPKLLRRSDIERSKAFSLALEALNWECDSSSTAKPWDRSLSVIALLGEELKGPRFVWKFWVDEDAMQEQRRVGLKGSYSPAGIQLWVEGLPDDWLWTAFEGPWRSLSPTVLPRNHEQCYHHSFEMAPFTALPNELRIDIAHYLPYYPDYNSFRCIDKLNRELLTSQEFITTFSFGPDENKWIPWFEKRLDPACEDRIAVAFRAIVRASGVPLPKPNPPLVFENPTTTEFLRSHAFFFQLLKVAYRKRKFNLKKKDGSSAHLLKAKKRLDRYMEMSWFDFGPVLFQTIGDDEEIQYEERLYQVVHYCLHRFWLEGKSKKKPDKGHATEGEPLLINAFYDSEFRKTVLYVLGKWMAEIMTPEKDRFWNLREDMENGMKRMCEGLEGACMLMDLMRTLFYFSNEWDFEGCACGCEYFGHGDAEEGHNHGDEEEGGESENGEE